MSEITEINKTMMAEFSGLRIVNGPMTFHGGSRLFLEPSTEKLVKIVYGDDKKLAQFIRRLGSDQTITCNYELPAAGIHLKNVNTSRIKDSLHLTYHLVVVTDTEEAANQVTEQVIGMLSPPLALNQHGDRFALESKYAKVELYDNDLYSDPVVELSEGKITYTRRYVLGVVTNFGDKPPHPEVDKEHYNEDEQCVSSSES